MEGNKSVNTQGQGKPLKTALQQIIELLVQY